MRKRTSSIRFIAFASVISALLLALMSSLSTLALSRASTLDASAINVAGTLRMQSYRLATKLLAKEVPEQTLEQLIVQFESTLSQPSLSSLMDEADADEARVAFVQAQRLWKTQMLPALQDESRWHDYLERVPVFVAELDRFVATLQTESENRNQSLRWSSRFTLITAIVLAVVVLLVVKKHILLPLRQLSTAAGFIRQGQFDVNVPYQKPNELGQLARAFNSMAEALALQHQSRERLVLHQQSSLTVLYQASQLQSADLLLSERCQSLLAQVAQLVGVGWCAVYLRTTSNDDLLEVMAQSSTLEQSGIPQKTSLYDLSRNKLIKTYPMFVQDTVFGALVIASAEAVDSDDEECVRTLATLLAGQVAHTQRRVQERRVALAEERSVIARELHDSIAQTLSYLKIQIVRLARVESGKAQDEVVTELKNGVDSAYLHLRQLISSFRISLNGLPLSQALKSMTNDFIKSHPKIEFTLACESEELNFSPNEEVHLYQLIREACLNAIEHAQPSVITITIIQPDEFVEIIVKDNGIGFDSEQTVENHFGLSIMKERSHSLGGDLQIDSKPGQGTRVELRFKPKIT